ncbi:hypothetical protein [Sphingobium nicotianae]|uniref:hypothetical protein n=1 Tax=Sphingobium nicotianae TaxID=2782607 RepID=UPI002033199D|nr:hypothetical protein [Sphingobium nicotianae]
MPAITTSLLLPILLASGAKAAPDGDDAPAPPPNARGSQWSQVTIEQRVIIRIPTIRQRPSRPASVTENGLPPPPPPPPIRWKEKKGPKCLPLNRIRGASITTQTGVTMLTLNNEAFRAHFGRACRSADFYAGFYIQPDRDGALCAGRDVLHARNGSTCEIEKFSRLEPERRDEDEDDR